MGEPEARKLKGVVTLPGGAPGPGVGGFVNQRYEQGFGYARHEFTTGEDGSFEVPWVSGVGVVAFAELAEVGRAAAHFENVPEVMALNLEAGARLHVRLRGGPRPMHVEVVPSDSDSPVVWMALFRADDTASFVGLPPGPARIEISRQAMPPTLARKTVELRTGELLEEEVVLEDLAEFSGWVTFRGASAPDAVISLTREDGRGQSASLGADRSFHFRDLAPGAWTLQVLSGFTGGQLLLELALASFPTEPLELVVERAKAKVKAKPKPLAKKPKPKRAPVKRKAVKSRKSKRR